MRWKYRRYRIWVINSETESQLYLWEKWSLLIPFLDCFVGLSKDAAFIRSFQCYEQENRWLGFGRMKWNEANNIKWTTKYRNATGSENLRFLGTEIWSPDWNQVCNDGYPPNLFIRLYSFPEHEKIREGLVIASAVSIYNKNKSVIETQLKNLAYQIPNSSITTTTRIWWPGWKSRNSIGDINNWEIEQIVVSKP